MNFIYIVKMSNSSNFQPYFKPDEDHPQHQLRCDRAAGVQEDHLPEHHQGDEGDNHDVKDGYDRKIIIWVI